MREIVITELAPEAVARLEAALKERGWAASLDRLYWLPLAMEDLTAEQQCHRDCGPHALALEMTRDGLRLELLVRARNRLHCSCIAPCQPWQIARVAEQLDQLLVACGISV